MYQYQTMMQQKQTALGVAGSSVWYYLASNYSKAYWDTFSLDKINVHSNWSESNAHSDRDADFLSNLKNEGIDLLITYFPPCDMEVET